MSHSSSSQPGSSEPHPIQVTVNGRVRAIPDAITVAGLLEQLEVDRRQVAVERNAELVPKTKFDDVHLEDGDTLEIVTFFGGG